MFKWFAIIILAAATIQAAVPTTLNDMFLPGSQPFESGTIQTSSGCNCHNNYDEAVEPVFNWTGSMMAQAARDPLFFACMTISNQDAPEVGDLCLRCHTPKGWLEGRSTPTDGSALIADDREGVVCHFCHKLIKPSPVGENPYPGDTAYAATTYLADSVYLSGMSLIPAHSANGMFIVDSIDFRRGPYTDPDAPHDWYYSPFHRDAALCGTCHDVSNPVYSRTPGGDYEPNTFDSAAPDFSPYAQFPVERTFSEWLHSDYNSAAGVYAPQFGGNKDTVRTCQDCHMHDVTGKGCKRGSAPTRDDLALHDLTGGNTFIPKLIDLAFPGDNVDLVALDSGIARATRMLKAAASMSLSSVVQSTNHEVSVLVTNETGHKLPSGYPEGRRIWLNVKAYDIGDNLIYESGAYDTSTGELTHDSDVKIYQIKPGISNSLSPIVSLPAGPSFHFVLNDSIYSDNRIPPRGFTNAAFDSIQSPPVAYTYADGQYWDNTGYLIPGSAAKVRVTLYYQTTSKEYVEFLRDENNTDHWGDSLYSWWSATGKSAPVAMQIDSLDLTPLTTNSPPLLASIGNKSTSESTLLSFAVGATDADADSIILQTSTLPTGASFTDNGDGTGGFNWTPTYDQAGSYPVTFYARDTLGGIDSEVISITVDNVNRPPELASIGNQSTSENSLLTFGTSASDPDGDSVYFETTTLPTGAVFTDNGDGTGAFNWTPTYDQAGLYPITFYARDTLGGTDSEVISITVANVNRPPVLASIGNKSTDENVLLSFAVSATDPDNDSLILTTSTLPTGALFVDSGNGAGSFAWTPTFDQSGVYPLTFYVDDTLGGKDSEVIQITVNNVNRPPELASIGNQSTSENTLLNFGTSATDADGDSVYFETSTLPTGAAFTDNGDGTGDFNWTPTYDQAGQYPLTFYARDTLGGVDSEVITITVDNVNRPPVLASIGNKSVQTGILLQFDVTGSDPDNDSLIHTVTPLPTGAAYTDHGNDTATFSWTPAPGDTGVYALTFVVADTGGLADSELISLTVTATPVNKPPVLQAIGPQETFEGALLGFGVAATDSDGVIDSLTTSSLPAGAVFVDSGNGAGSFSWTPTLDQAGSYPVTFYAYDDSAAVDSEVVSINVLNVNQAPLLATVENQSTDENLLLTFAVTATDPDDNLSDISIDPLPTGASFTYDGTSSAQFSWTPTYDQAGSYPVQFIAIDDSSAADTQDVLITIADINRAPELSPAGPFSATEGETIEFVVVASDPDGNNLTFSLLSLPAGAMFEDSLNGHCLFRWPTVSGDAGTYFPGFVATDGLLSDTIDVQVDILASVGCCIGIRGNVNDLADVDIADLTYLVAFMFKGGPAPPCYDEGNVNGLADIDIADLTYLVNYMFKSGPAPVACPVP